MNKLLSSFISYYKTQKFNQDIIDEILNYDFVDYEDLMSTIAGLKNAIEFQGNHFLVKSNGSMSNSSYYNFGPDFEHWCPSIEKILRNCFVSLRISHDNIDTEWNHYVRPFVFFRNGSYCAYLNMSSKRNLVQLNEIIGNLYEKYGCPISICGKPSSWLLVSTSPEIMDSLKSCKPFIKSLINEDWELWVKSNIRRQFYVNDQMIDWKSGLNFYTCEYNTKHFLPIFHFNKGHAVNLLNLKMSYVKLTDSWQLTGNEKICKCGRKYIPFEFISHCKNNLPINKNIIEGFESSYSNLQFLKGNQIKVFYSCLGDFKDKDLIEKNVDRAVFVPNKRFYVGRKRYNFWIEGNNIDYSDVSPCFENKIKLS